MEANGRPSADAPKEAVQGYHPDWSPDGGWIAFNSAQRGGVGAFIHVMKPDWSQLRQFDTNGNGVDPSWGADSRHIAFIEYQDGNKIELSGPGCP